MAHALILNPIAPTKTDALLVNSDAGMVVAHKTLARIGSQKIILALLARAQEMVMDCQTLVLPRRLTAATMDSAPHPTCSALTLTSLAASLVFCATNQRHALMAHVLLTQFNAQPFIPAQLALFVAQVMQVARPLHKTVLPAHDGVHALLLCLSAALMVSVLGISTNVLEPIVARKMRQSNATTVLAWAQLLIAIPSLNSLTVAQLPHHTNAWKAPVSLTVPSAGKMAVIALRSDALTEAAKLIALAFLLLAQALFALMDSANPRSQIARPVKAALSSHQFAALMAVALLNTTIALPLLPAQARLTLSAMTEHVLVIPNCASLSSLAQSLHHSDVVMANA